MGGGLQKLGNWIDEHKRCIVSEGRGGGIVVGRRESDDGRGDDGLASLMI